MKTWTSPTAIDLDKMVWEYGYEITKVTGTVNLGIFGNATQDITSSIPEDDRIGDGESRDLPAVLLDETLSEPESGTSARRIRGSRQSRLWPGGVQRYHARVDQRAFIRNAAD